MPGRQLGAVLAVGILDDQFAAVVFIRPGQEQRAGQVGADAKISVAHGTDRIVDMGAESLPRAIAVEQRRENLERQRSEERRVGKECGRTCRSRWSPYP